MSAAQAPDASGKKLSRRDLDDLVEASRSATMLLGQMVLWLNDFRTDDRGKEEIAHNEVVVYRLPEETDRALFAARAYALEEARKLEEAFHLSSGAIE